MKFNTVLAVLASLAANAMAVGVLDECTGKGGSGCTAVTGWTPPAGCDGGCAKFNGPIKSVKQVSVDSGYCFTVYTDVGCTAGAAHKVPSNKFLNGNFKALSYDCC